MSKKSQEKEQEQIPVNRVRMQFELAYKGSQGKEMNGKSSTVPDMQLTCRQLLESYTTGSNVPTKKPLYFEVPLPTVRDITDVTRYRKAVNDQLKHIDKFIKEEREAIAEAEKAKKEKVPVEVKTPEE